MENATSWGERSVFKAWRNLEGDLNNDQIVNIVDIIQLVNTIVDNLGYNDLSDINQDGFLNVSDIILLVNIIIS